MHLGLDLKGFVLSFGTIAAIGTQSLDSLSVLGFVVSALVCDAEFPLKDLRLVPDQKYRRHRYPVLGFVVSAPVCDAEFPLKDLHLVPNQKLRTSKGGVRYCNDLG